MPKYLLINELKDKSSGVDNVSFNIIKKCFEVLSRTLNLPVSKNNNNKKISKIIFLSVPCIHYKLMKLNFAIYLVLSLS